MRWIERRPRDVTEQFLEYARTGRLVDGTAPRNDDLRSAAALVVVAALSLGAGLALVGSGLLGATGETTTLVAIMVVLGALAILVPGIRLLASLPRTRPVTVRPAAVLPPELVRVGNWIHRNGAWLRVEQIGRDGSGATHALLSSGDVVELTLPVTIAGDDFRPVVDPVAELRH
jgi:hypothetical protein